MHKRLVMLSVAALGLTAAIQSAAAQVPLVPKPSFGILGGINVATLKGNDVTDASNRTGFAGGVFLTLHVSPTFAIEPEALYSQQGAKASDGGDVGTVKLDYIQVPVLLRFDVPTSSTPIHPFFVLGPAASFQVKCDVAGTLNDEPFSGSCDDFNDQVEGGFKKKSFDWSAVGGAGVAFSLGATNLSVSARYNYGFSDTFEGSDIKNRYFSILAGLSF